MIPFEDTVSVDLDRDDLQSAGQALVRGEMTGIGEQIAIVGETALSGEAICARCLSSFSVTVAARLEETFTRKGNQQELSEDEDIDVHLYEGEMVDLTEMAQAALLLNIPMRFLCKEDCKGLCPVCGTDRNEQSCQCDDPNNDNPFSALRSLLTDK